MESEPSRAIRVWSSPFRARSRTKTGTHAYSQARPSPQTAREHVRKKTSELTEAPFVLKRPVQAHDARVPRAQADQRVLLRERGLLLLVALEVGLVYPLDGVLLARREEGAQPHLRARQCVRQPNGEGGRGGDSGVVVLTVEYEPWPSSSLKTKSSTVMRPLTELLRDLDCVRDAGGLSGDGSSSGRPSSLVIYAGGREPRGVVGLCGLRERRFVRGAEKLRRGLGREGVWRVRSGEEELEEEEDITEAFRLSSARVGVVGCVVSGDGVVTWSLSIRGRRRTKAGGRL